MSVLYRGTNDISNVIMYPYCQLYLSGEDISVYHSEWTEVHDKGNTFPTFFLKFIKHDLESITAEAWLTYCSGLVRNWQYTSSDIDFFRMFIKLNKEFLTVCANYHGLKNLLRSSKYFSISHLDSFTVSEESSGNIFVGEDIL